ncbi:DUF1707 SHOCT-like domain-containing protein [Gordonia rhizosphera]|uniref:DUF1707 domain-containing protein n=1 Tax=Gordonia rhizosphera NBRC 16068 TaxID=1108045 RepID=K6W3Y0_9ACTN|nr:DUF1707 domain-containing protein [Gordonia rhizosphera]GAB88436.1 hypothetical protein GORHZ_022_00080 [Gordonia rhizosphera NBRC 16068]
MTTPDNLPAPDDRRARLRAADADRELVHQILSAAMSKGNLSMAEFEERSGKAMVAKTFGDLDELTDDLPVGQLGVPMPFVGEPSGSRVSPGSGRQPVRQRFALMSGAEVRGNVAVADTFTATAFMGAVEIDLRDAEFTAPVLTIRCFALMGGVEVIVPPDVAVEIGGWAVMGGFGGRATGPGAPGTPTVRVVGFALMGAVDVKRKDRIPPEGGRAEV